MQAEEYNALMEKRLLLVEKNLNEIQDNLPHDCEDPYQRLLSNLLNSARIKAEEAKDLVKSGDPDEVDEASMELQKAFNEVVRILIRRNYGQIP